MYIFYRYILHQRILADSSNLQMVCCRIKTGCFPTFFEGHTCTAALTITESKLTVKTGSSSVMKLLVFKYINSLRKMFLSCSGFVSNIMLTCDRDCAGRANIADVLCSQWSSVDATAGDYRKV